MIRYCSRCLYTSSHPLNLVIDEQGVCSGCRVHEEKDSLDWTERFEKLRTIVNGYRSQKNYDCIVPVSGARDSYFIVYIVKEVLGLNPLLVTYNQHYNTYMGIRNLANLRIQFASDNACLFQTSGYPAVFVRFGKILHFGAVHYRHRYGSSCIAQCHCTDPSSL